MLLELTAPLRAQRDQYITRMHSLEDLYATETIGSFNPIQRVIALDEIRECEVRISELTDEIERSIAHAAENWKK